MSMATNMVLVCCTVLSGLVHTHLVVAANTACFDLTLALVTF